MLKDKIIEALYFEADTYVRLRVEFTSQDIHEKSYYE